MQKITISGFLGQDAEYNAEKSYTKLSVAVKGREKKNGVWEDVTTWYNCIKFEKKEGGRPKLCDYLTKGTGVIVQGDIAITEVDGKRYVNVKAEFLEITSKVSSGQSAPQREPTPYQQQQNAPSAENELPF